MSIMKDERRKEGWREQNKKGLIDFLHFSDPNVFTSLWFVMVINNVRTARTRIQTPAPHVQDHSDFQKEKVIWQRFLARTGNNLTGITQHSFKQLTLI